MLLQCQFFTDWLNREQRKCKQTVENDTGSWRLFGGLEGHIIPH